MMDSVLNRSRPGIGLLAILLALPQLSETIYTPVLPAIAQGFDVSESMAQLTMSIYFVGFALDVLTWGWLADHWGRRSTMLAGLLCYGMGAAGAIISSEFMLLLGARFLLAFGISAGSVVTQTVIRDCFSGKALGKLCSTVGAVISLSLAIGPVLGSIGAMAGGYQAVFIMLGGTALLMSFWTGLSLPETHPGQEPVKGNKGSLLVRMIRDRKIRVYSVMVAGANVVLFGYFTLGPFLIKQIGFSASVFGVTGVLIAMGSALGAMFNRKLLTRYSGEQLIHWGSCLGVLGAILQLMVTLFLPSVPFMALLLVIAPMVLMVIAFGLIVPNLLSSALSEYKDELGTAGALFGLSYYLLIAAGLALVSHHYVSAAVYMPAVFLVIFLLMLMIWSYYHQHILRR